MLPVDGELKGDHAYLMLCCRQSCQAAQLRIGRVKRILWAGSRSDERKCDAKKEHLSYQRAVVHLMLGLCPC
jgi:hypothetical protein